MKQPDEEYKFTKSHNLHTYISPTVVEVPLLSRFYREFDKNIEGLFSCTLTLISENVL